MKDKKTFKCGCCDSRFSIKIGMIFEGSNIPLKKWFISIYIIGVIKKTAWFMLQRIREVAKVDFLN